MKTIYTKHALRKFFDLAKLGIRVNKSIVNDAIKNPLHVDHETDPPKIIASGNLDPDHVIRVVYHKENDIIRIITFYPAKKGRYLI